MSSKDFEIDMDHIITLFKTLQQDAIDNGIKMFNANEPQVNHNNMLIHFHQFIKKYVSVNRPIRDIINL